MKKTVLFVTVSVLLLALTSCFTLSPNVYAKATSYPSESRPWPAPGNDVLDYAKLSADLSQMGFTEIIVLPINKDKVSFDSFDRDPDEERDEDSDEVAQKYLDEIDTLYWENVQILGENLPIPVSWEKGTGSGNALILEMDVQVINPGARSARYWIGYGAGATELRMEGRLIDGSTKEVLAVFNGADYGLGGAYGGDSYELLVYNMGQLVIKRIGSLIATSLN
jgi:hypothetical protein